MRRGPSLCTDIDTPCPGEQLERIAVTSDRSDGSLVLHIAASSDVGRQRAHNEDSFLVADLTDEPRIGRGISPLSPFEPGTVITSHVGPKGTLLMVADGMGGARAGEIASRMAVDGVYRRLVQDWAKGAGSSPNGLAKHMAYAITATNRRIFDAARSNSAYSGMGTTATVCCVLGDGVYVAQVGDSRAYLVRRGNAIQITRDQSVVQHLVQTGRLSKEEAARSRGRNILLQAMGTVAEIDVDLTRQSLRQGDYLVVCSDGLSSLVQPGEMSTTVEHADDPAGACAELIELANRRGGPDNITVIVARAEGVRLDPPDDGDPVGHFTYSVD